MLIPNQLRTNILNLYGKKGQAWLENLKTLIDAFESNHRVKIGDCYPDANFNYVAPACFDDNTLAVFKCSVPNKSLTQEAAALRHYNGHGSVELLFFDNDAGTMLLERAKPGDLLENYNCSTEDACRFAIEIMHRLHQPIENNNNYPTLNDWFQGFEKLRQRFNGKTGPFSENLIDKAEKISTDLLKSITNKVLLHGDLHYANLLASDKHGWIAIDPKGVVGESEFEIPLPRLGTEVIPKVIQHNIDCFIEISGFDRKKILNWLFVKAVLAAWWSYEDSGDIWLPFIEYAEVVNPSLV